MRILFRAGAHPSMCTQEAYIGDEFEPRPELEPKISGKFQHLLTKCACWVHIPARAPRDERHLYRLSIHGSIDFGPGV